MNSKKSVLLMVRGPRLNAYFRQMAEYLGQGYRVIVMTDDAHLDSFRDMEGVTAYAYRSVDAAPSAAAAREQMRARGPRPDLARAVARIEEELGITAYQTATNYLLYGEAVRRQHGEWWYMTTEEEILSAYHDAYQQLSEIFAEHQPVAVFYETVDRIPYYVALAIAEKTGALTFEFKFAPLMTGRMMLVSGPRRQNILLQHLLRHPELIREESYRAADAFLEQYLDRPDHSAYASVHRKMISGNSPFSPSRYLGMLGDLWRGRSREINVRRQLAMIRNRMWLRRNLTTQIPTEPYIAFFLQHSPEATTFSEVPRWAQQDVVIQRIALAAPAGLKVLVKEHPRTFGLRGEAFFDRLARLPNVVLCHPGVDNFSLLSNCEAVVALTGSVGLEGVLFGKPVFTLGRPFYSIFEHVRRIDQPEEVFDWLGHGRQTTGDFEAARREFLAAFIQSTFPLGEGRGLDMWPADGGTRWGQALDEMLKRVEEWEIKGSDFDIGVRPLSRDEPALPAAQP